MTMHNPPHPGEFIREVYLEPFAMTGRQLAVKQDVAPSILSCILNGNSDISSEMALRVSGLPPIGGKRGGLSFDKRLFFVYN
jgi:addiction module HigA family antidote